MEWTASASIAATSQVSAPKPPSNPTSNNDKNGDVPMGEATEEVKEKTKTVVHKDKQQEKNKENRVHWGENVVHEVVNDKNNNKLDKGKWETQQEMIWVPKGTVSKAKETTKAALTAKTPVTDAPRTKKQEATTSETKATEETKQATAATASPPKPKKERKTEATKKSTEEIKQATATAATTPEPAKKQAASNETPRTTKEKVMQQ